MTFFVLRLEHSYRCFMSQCALRDVVTVSLEVVA